MNFCRRIPIKPNFDTHAAFVSLINSGIPEKQAEQLLETIKDSQADLSTKSDIHDLMVKLDGFGLQLKGLYFIYAANTAILAWICNKLFELLDRLPKPG